MKELVLNDLESRELKKNGYVIIKRNGFEIFVKHHLLFNDGKDFTIKILNPYKKVSVKYEIN